MIYYNTEEAAKILGVNVSTIKRWSSAGRLQCIRTAGGHRKFEMHHLAEFVETNKKVKTNVAAIQIEDSNNLQLNEWILKADYDNLVRFIQSQAIKCNKIRILDVFKGLYLSKRPLHEIYDFLVAPVLRSLGVMWEEGQLSITEEHFASQTLKDAIIRMQSMMPQAEKKLGVVMAMNLSNEMHDIVLKMVDHILEHKGYKVLYSGQMTPQLSIENIFDDYAPKRLYVSSTFVDNVDHVESEFKKVCGLAEKYSVKVFVGGQGFDLLDYSHPAIMDRLYTFKDAHEK